jgi:hypothetical protein
VDRVLPDYLRVDPSPVIVIKYSPAGTFAGYHLATKLNSPILKLLNRLPAGYNIADHDHESVERRNPLVAMHRHLLADPGSREWSWGCNLGEHGSGAVRRSLEDREGSVFSDDLII